MLDFYAKSYTRWVELLAESEQALRAGASDARGRAATALSELGKVLEQAGFDSLAQRGRSAMQLWNNGQFPQDVALHEVSQFRSALQAELGSHLYFVVPKGDRARYENQPLSSDAASSFTAANEELRQAGKCFALDRHTAAVFHAMRALESGLYSLAYRIRAPRRNDWGRLIQSIEERLRELRAGKKLTAKRRRFLDACAEAATHFIFLKDAWRNHTMHLRQSYDRDRSEEIFKHACRFLEVLAAEGIRERIQR